MSLPTGLELGAFSSGEELAWPKERLPEVLRSLSEQGLAVLGGELWVVAGGVIHAGHVLKSTRQVAVCAWEAAPRGEEETWAMFVERCAEENLKITSTLDPERDFVPIPSGLIYYNLTWVAQDEYEQIKERAG